MLTCRRLFFAGLAACVMAGCVQVTPASLPPVSERAPARANWDYGADFENPAPGQVTLAVDREFGVKVGENGMRLSTPDPQLEANLNQILEQFGVVRIVGTHDLGAPNPSYFYLSFPSETDTRSVVTAFRAIKAVNKAYRPGVLTGTSG